MCSYLRFVYEDGSIQCSFLISKSKAMPVRPISISRLELQAATLSARVYQVCREELTYKIDRVVFWTDSQTTLQYIKNESKRFQTYVANRIAEIREMTSPDQWRHCPGKLNPADDASHGLKSQKLIDQHRWWKGPEYLWESEENWPEAEIGEVSQNDPEVRDEVQAHSIKIENPDPGFYSEAPCASDRPVYKMMTRYSSWLKLQRSVAWLVRFCHWLRNRKTSSCTEALTTEELREATLLVMRLVQAQSFAEELRDLKANKQVKSSSRLAKLKPVLADAVLRVGGRLEEAVALSYDEKHPIILPKKHHVSRLIVRFCHESLAHAGREQTLAQTRKMFWILGGRGLAKNIIRNCFKCRRLNERPMKQVMAPLPKERLQPYKPPFTFSGVDFLGPLMVKWGRGSAKRWGCLFPGASTIIGD